MTQDLGEQLASLRLIVMETIEQSRNLLLSDVATTELEERQDRWTLERRLQQSISSDQQERYERELEACYRVCTMEDLNSLQLVL